MKRNEANEELIKLIQETLTAFKERSGEYSKEIYQPILDKCTTILARLHRKNHDEKFKKIVSDHVKELQVLVLDHPIFKLWGDYKITPHDKIRMGKILIILGNLQKSF